MSVLNCVIEEDVELCPDTVDLMRKMTPKSKMLKSETKASVVSMRQTLPVVILLRLSGVQMREIMLDGVGFTFL